MYNPQEIEKEILKFWEDRKIFEKVKKRNSKGKPFYFLQGPPYTSGKLHIAHAWNNSLKDMILRYKRMNRFDVWDRAGYDMHGLPTENKVQEKLKLKNKDDVIKFGMGKFVKECLNFSREHAGYMNDDLWKFGVWMDLKNAYLPIEKEFIEGEWSFIKKSWEQGRIYKGMKVMHWDAQSETALAKHELEYETIKDDSIFLKFKKQGTKNEYFIIWTTTPWTIPFNLAIMVHPDLKYVKVKVGNEYWIIAEDLANAFITKLLGKKLEIVEKFKGSKLRGQSYEHPMYNNLKEYYDSFKKNWKNVHTVILSKDYVDTSAGSGLVHCAPGCGPEDFEVGKKYGIGPVNTLNERGEFENLGKYTGWKAKEDDKKFVEELDLLGALVLTTNVEHDYPHSWRSHKPVVFRTTEQWFLKIEDIVSKLLKSNDKVSWVPKKSGENYARWTSNLRDNSITRQRFWGCPVPIWVNEEDDKDFIVIGSVKELEKYVPKNKIPKDLHRPMIDKVVIKKDGKTYKRVPDVIDVWIDSGTTSWNSLYNDPKLIKKYYPADLVLEATEMTKLWFSMLQICSHIYFGKSSYDNVHTHGMILDYQGMKMSKSLGNIISPYEVIDKYSVDIFRNYICQTTAGENINFSWEDIKVKQRNLIIFNNIAKYILDIDKQNVKKGKPGIEEKWIMSKCNSALKEVTELFDNYQLDKTIGVIEGLYLAVSRDYIKMVRDKSDKNSAVLDTLKEVYTRILEMFSTVCPFICDHLWQQLRERKIVKEESVHLSSWPKVGKIDVKLEQQFATVFEIIEVGLRERDKAGIGLKWPLAKAVVNSKESVSSELKEIIMNQLQVKGVEVIVKKNKEVSVEFDMNLTSELEAEGFARNIARAVQALRKKQGLVKNDKISLKIFAGADLVLRLDEFKEFLSERTNAKEFSIKENVENIKGFSEDKINIKGEEIGIFLKKI